MADSTDDCPVCMEDMGGDSHPRAPCCPECGKAVCVVCRASIKAHAAERGVQRTCPMCRTAVPSTPGRVDATQPPTSPSTLRLVAVLTYPGATVVPVGDTSDAASAPPAPQQQHFRVHYYHDADAFNDLVVQLTASRRRSRSARARSCTLAQIVLNLFALAACMSILILLTSA